MLNRLKIAWFSAGAKRNRVSIQFMEALESIFIPGIAGHTHAVMQSAHVHGNLKCRPTSMGPIYRLFK
jgi:hypothetical protein